VAGAGGVQLVPDLASSLPTPTNGGKQYTFQVRPGIHYSDGRLVQPGDFKRAIERSLVLDPYAGDTFAKIVGAGRCKNSSRNEGTSRLMAKASGIRRQTGRGAGGCCAVVGVGRVVGAG
jgi:ABC-type transport system substrate-binding protein